MKPRDARLAIDIYTGAVVVSVAMALAGLTWRLLGDPGVSPIGAPVVTSAGVGDDIRPIIALAPFGMAVAAPPAGPASSALQLRGVLMTTPPEASVALIETEGGTTGSYSVGTAVGGGVIEAIRADEVTIRTAGGLQILSLSPAGVAGSASGGSGKAAAAALSGAQPSPTVDQTAAGAPSASSGYVVGAAPGPQLVAAGLRPGDVITQVNGTAVGSGANEHELLARAATLGQAQIELLRDGRRVSLSVPIK